MPPMPSRSASSLKRSTVSPMASTAPATASGRSRKSAARRSPESLRAIDNGEKTVASTGASPMRRSKPRRTIVSSCSTHPSALAGSSGRMRFQSSAAFTAHDAHGRCPVGSTWSDSTQPQASTQ